MTASFAIFEGRGAFSLLMRASCELGSILASFHVMALGAHRQRLRFMAELWMAHPEDPRVGLYGPLTSWNSTRMTDHSCFYRQN